MARKAFKFFFIVVSIVLWGINSVALADNEEPEADFLVPPVHLTLQLPNNTTRSLSIAGYTNKSTKKPGIGVTIAGPNKACPGETKDYAGYANPIEKYGLATAIAKFEGDPFEPAEIDGEYWLYKSRPVAIYYRTDGKIGKSEGGQWEEIVAAVIYPDPRKSKDTRMKILVFKPKRTEVVDGHTIVVAGDISRAIQVKIAVEKPAFIGDLAKLAELTANASKGADHTGNTRQASK